VRDDYRATGLTERLRAGPMRAHDRNRAWIVVSLLFIFMVINFADRAVTGIAAVPIMQELKLGPRQFGLVGSSFFLPFAVSSVAAGFLVNRVQTRWVLLAMGLIWALTQFPMIGSVGLETLVACRIAHALKPWEQNPLGCVATTDPLRTVSPRYLFPSAAPK
jgi:MFS transporter, ACS family, D-galactonate transporter